MAGSLPPVPAAAAAAAAVATPTLPRPQSGKKRFWVGQAILPADSLSAGPAAWKAACFFEPANLSGVKPFSVTHVPRSPKNRRLASGTNPAWVHQEAAVVFAHPSK